jgi:predicted metal-dependent phosphotriesterase family hydrolase
VNIGLEYTTNGGNVPTVETVLGPIGDAALGFTLSHEHVLVAMGADTLNYPWLFDWEQTRSNAVRELSEAIAGGDLPRGVE